MIRLDVRRPVSVFLLMVLGLVLTATAATAEAEAQERRYAIIMGANDGEPDQVPLRFAERDAERVAEVMRSLGGVAPQNLVVLLGRPVSEFEAVIASFEERIARDKASHPEAEDTLLFIFYSGHADASSLHMRGTRLPFDRLRGLLETSNADARVLVIDACRSGELTRVKGAAPAEPFQLQTKDWTIARGMAIVTSAAAGEDAQESDRLKGGFFTHHFVNGLLGAADQKGRGEVSLSDVYRYAYAETVRSTSRAPFLQHPTYAFDLRGRDEVILTRVSHYGQGLGQLTLRERGTYLVFEGNDRGSILADLTVDEPTRLVLPQGTYFLRLRRSDAFYETSLQIVSGQETRPIIGQMTRVPYGTVVRRGATDAPASAYALVVAAALAGEILDGTGPVGAGHLGLRIDRRVATFELAMRYGRSRGGNDVVILEQHLLGLELSARRLFELGRLSLGPGIRAGLDGVRQSFVAETIVPARQSVLGRAGVLGHVEFSLATRMGLFAEVGVDVHGLERFNATLKTSAFEWTFAPTASAGLTVYLP
jgi:hypothetical protein